MTPRVQSYGERFAGAALFLFGFVMITGFLIRLTEGKGDGSDGIALVFLGIVPALGGVFLFWRGRNKAREQGELREQQAILRIAAQRDGTLLEGESRELERRVLSSAAPQ